MPHAALTAAGFASTVTGRSVARGARVAFVGVLVVLALAAAVVPEAAAAAPHGATSHDAKLRLALDRFVAAGVPGAVVLERDGRRTVRLASGAGRLKPRTAIRITDRFRVGSLTKPFVATVVLELAGEGKLSLDDSVERWLPGLVPNGQNITIRQLLSHTSGLFDYTNDDATFTPFVQGDRNHSWTPQELIAIAVKHPPVFAPGAAWDYSNTGFILLGLIVQAATGDTIQAELHRRVFAPLRLRHTTFDTQGRIAGRHAHGYSRLLSPTHARQDVSDLNPSWGWAAGAIVSTADNIATFYRALLTGHLLSPPLLAQMQTAVSMGVPGERYGLGLWRTHTFVISPKLRLSCGAAWGHNGDIFGYHADAFVRPSSGRQIVLLATTANDEYNARIETAQFHLLDVGLCG